MAVKDMKNDELVDHYYELKHLNADDEETAKYYKELVCEMAERFAIMIENEVQDHCNAINRDCDDPGYTQILIKNNGEAVAVSTKWDITIHCDSEEEQKHVMELLEKFDEQEPRKGHWIEERNDYGEITHWHCSNCYDDSGFITTCKWDFCPQCGSDNREV